MWWCLGAWVFEGVWSPSPWCPGLSSQPLLLRATFQGRRPPAPRCPPTEGQKFLQKEPPRTLNSEKQKKGWCLNLTPLNVSENRDFLLWSSDDHHHRKTSPKSTPALLSKDMDGKKQILGTHPGKTASDNKWLIKWPLGKYTGKFLVLGKSNNLVMLYPPTWKYFTGIVCDR